MLKLEEIAEGRALLDRAKAGEPGAVQDLGAWFEAYAGMMLDAFERVHAPLVHPKRRFCPECGNRSFWPHASWCSGNEAGPSEGEPPGGDYVVAPERAAVFTPAESKVVDSTLRTRAALTRVAELESAMKEAFQGRPMLLSRDDVATNPRAVRLQEVEAWFLSQGVRCRVTTKRGGPYGYQLVFLEAELVPPSPANAPCKTCGGDGFVDPGYGRWTEPCPDCAGTGEIVLDPIKLRTSA